MEGNNSVKNRQRERPLQRANPRQAGPSAAVRRGAVRPSALTAVISIAARHAAAQRYAHTDVGSATAEIAVGPVFARITGERPPARSVAALLSAIMVDSAHSAGTVVDLLYANMDFRNQSVKSVVALVSVTMVGGR